MVTMVDDDYLTLSSGAAMGRRTFLWAMLALSVIASLASIYIGLTLTVLGDISIALQDQSPQYDDNRLERIREEPKAQKDWPPTAQLDAILEETTKKRLIVAASNAGYADFADNFFQSLLDLNVTNFVLVPLDTTAYEILHEVYPKHVLPLIPGLAGPEAVTEAADFGSEEFEKLTSTRPIFLLPFLEKGYTIFYNDIDMVWKRNAWAVVDDLDWEAKEEFGDTSLTVPTTLLWDDGPEQVCSCLLYLPPSPETILVLTEWRDEIVLGSGKYTNDQIPFMALLSEIGLSSDVARFDGEDSGLIRLIQNNEMFPHGQKYFDNFGNLYNRSNAVIVHNNWIVGKEEKRERFEELGLWKPTGKVRIPAA